jgi:hypothetical protein
LSNFPERRRGSESNGVFTDCQPQYPDFQGYFITGFTGVQAVFITIRSLPDLTRHIPAAYSVIEEIVEGFVEDFSIEFAHANSIKRVDSRENLTQAGKSFQVVDSQSALPGLSFIKHPFELGFNLFF